MYFVKKSCKVMFIKDNKIELLEEVMLILNNDDNIAVSKGFICDGASIPKFFYRVIGHPFQTKFILAAVIHDYLYATHEYDKNFSDKLFLKLLKQAKVPMWKRQLMYYSVKWFGKSAWNN